MMVAMATDVRVILIKLADRLHNMRTLGALPKQKQLSKAARDARDLRAARAPARDPRDQVGARGPRLPDPAPAQVRGDQEAGQPAAGRARAVRRRRRRHPRRASSARSGSRREISGRAKHFYSIYTKMTKKGREFNEIYDLTAMRVIVGSVKDCYGAIGVIHSLWKPLPGRFKDFIAMPKLNLYQALHTTVIGPEGQPLEIQIRTRGDARAGRVRRRRARRLQGGRQRQAPQAGGVAKSKMTWLRQLLDEDGDAGPDRVPRGAQGRPVRGRGLRLHAEGRDQEPRGRLDAARLRLRGAHRRRPPLRRRQGQRQDRAAPLPAEERRHRRGADREARARSLARLAQPGEDDPRPQQDPRLPQAGATRGRREGRPRAPRRGTPQARPAAAADRRLAAAGRRDPRDGLPQGRRLLHRPRAGQDLDRDRRQQADAATQGRRRGRRG